MSHPTDLFRYYLVREGWQNQMQDKQAHWNVQNRFSQKILQNSLTDFSGCTHRVQDQSFRVLAQLHFSYWHGFFSVYQECRCLSKTHKNLWETFHIQNWVFRSGCSIQWQSYSFFGKNKPVPVRMPPFSLWKLKLWLKDWRELRKFIWKLYFWSTARMYIFTHSQPYFQNLFWY